MWSARRQEGTRTDGEDVKIVYRFTATARWRVFVPPAPKATTPAGGEDVAKRCLVHRGAEASLGILGASGTSVPVLYATLTSNTQRLLPLSFDSLRVAWTGRPKTAAKASF
jgi:hypothetical protein